MNFKELIEALSEKEEKIKEKLKKLDEERCHCNFCNEEEGEEEDESHFEIDREKFENGFRKLPFWVNDLDDYKKHVLSLQADVMAMGACLRLVELWNILSPEQHKRLVKLHKDHLDIFYEIMQEDRDFDEQFSKEGEE